MSPSVPLHFPHAPLQSRRTVAGRQDGVRSNRRRDTHPSACRGTAEFHLCSPHRRSSSTPTPHTGRFPSPRSRFPTLHPKFQHSSNRHKIISMTTMMALPFRAITNCPFQSSTARKIQLASLIAATTSSARSELVKPTRCGWHPSI